MNDPLDRLQKKFEEQQALHGLKQFASKSAFERFGRDWKNFLNNVVCPAFERTKQKFPGKDFVKFPNPEQIGFKVRDFPDSEFLFWIELRGRIPSAQARRGTPGKQEVSVVATPHLSSKAHYELTDVSEEELVSAIAYAYEKSFFGQ